MTFPTPATLAQRFPLSPQDTAFIAASRRTACDILSGHNGRLMVLVGPCSIHNPSSALEYARRLAQLAPSVPSLFLVMRTYFEKPRTTLGWKGFINDPALDDSCDIARGLASTRELLVQIASLGLPTATEFLDPLAAPYFSDLITVGSIGARTTESPAHRQLASLLPCPIGFKNTTDGSFATAIDAMTVAAATHTFLGVDSSGQLAPLTSTGNPTPFLILRGGRSGPNYSASSIAAATAALSTAGKPPYVCVDCSHGNSGKDFRRQGEVFTNLLAQRTTGNTSIAAAMLESFLKEGAQKFSATPSPDISLTDSCIGWDETAQLLTHAHKILS